MLRLPTALDAATQARLRVAVDRRLGVLYDTGFDLHSRRQFCSRFVHEVIEEAVGEPVGEVQTLAELFERNPQARLAFWRTWYLGSIPWARQTITPASLLSNPRLRPVFDGRMAPGIKLPPGAAMLITILLMFFACFVLERWVPGWRLPAVRT